MEERLQKILKRDKVVHIPVNPSLAESIVEIFTNSERVTTFRRINLPKVGELTIHYPNFILRNDPLDMEM